MADQHRIDYARNTFTREDRRAYEDLLIQRAQIVISIGALFVLFCILAENSCEAQPTPPPAPAHYHVIDPSPRTTSIARLSTPAPFAWRRPALLGTTALIIGDGISTRQWVRHEDNPLARAIARNTNGGQITACALGITATYGATYLLHRTHHHRLERWLPRVVFIAEAVAITNNSLRR